MFVFMWNILYWIDVEITFFANVILNIFTKVKHKVYILYHFIYKIILFLPFF
ncbi:MAG: hypothetical protein RL757_2318 [Bacteroidota bacterium]|jgi:hypothetical protein